MIPASASYSNIKVLPDHLAKIARELCTTIVSTISYDVDQSEYERRCKRNGLVLLPMIRGDMLDEIDGDAGDAIEAVTTALCHAGPSELKPDVVKRFFNEITEWNDAQEAHRIMPDSHKA